MIKFLFCILLWIVPWRIRRLLLIYCLGYEIAPTAYIGYSVVIANAVTLGSNTRIGHLTVVKGLDQLSLAEGSRLGNLNWVTGYISQQNDRRTSALSLCAHSAITHRHLIDCTDRITVGQFSTIAGWHSQLVSHSIDLAISRQTSEPITIGEYCFVGSRCILLKGSSLPDNSVLGAGSILTTALSEPFSLYAGNPAKHIKSLPRDLLYFGRRIGVVS